MPAVQRALDQAEERRNRKVAEADRDRMLCELSDANRQGQNLELSAADLRTLQNNS